MISTAVDHTIHICTHPHPLERPESAWLCTSAETTSPKEPMKLRRSSLVVPHERLPTNTVLLTGAATAGTGGATTAATAAKGNGVRRQGRNGGSHAGREGRQVN